MGYREMIDSGRRAEYNEYLRVVQRAKYAERKQLAIEYLGGECVDCGSTGNLEFDHVDPSMKSFSITKKLNNAPWDRILKELDKCVLRDKDCHKARTKLQNKDHSFNGRTSPL